MERKAVLIRSPGIRFMLYRFAADIAFFYIEIFITDHKVG